MPTYTVFSDKEAPLKIGAAPISLEDLSSELANFSVEEMSASISRARDSQKKGGVFLTEVQKNKVAQELHHYDKLLDEHKKLMNEYKQVKLEQAALIKKNKILLSFSFFSGLFLIVVSLGSLIVFK